MAISPAVAQAILGQRAPDITGAFQRGQDTAHQRQERSRQDKIRELSGMAAQGEEGALGELTGIAPEAALKLREAMGAKDDAAADRFLRDARTGEKLLASGDTQGFIALARGRLGALQQMGDDTTQTQFILDRVLAGDTAGALNMLTSITSGVDQLKQQTDTPDQREFAQFQAMPEDTEKQRTEKKQFGQLIGAITKLKERLTPEQIIAEKRAEGLGTTRGKKGEEARQVAIQQARTARPMIKNLDRMTKLNDAILSGKTAAARKMFGDVFGVTDPDLGEFNSRAGKLVLSQIRMLGANPTEGERAFLTEIAPSISQSGGVNAVILKDLKEIAERQVARGKWLVNNRDKDMEDFFLFNEQDEFVGSSGGQAAPAQQAAPQRMRFDAQGNPI